MMGDIIIEIDEDGNVHPPDAKNPYGTKVPSGMPTDHEQLATRLRERAERQEKFPSRLIVRKKVWADEIADLRAAADIVAQSIKENP